MTKLCKEEASSRGRSRQGPEQTLQYLVDSINCMRTDGDSSYEACWLDRLLCMDHSFHKTPTLLLGFYVTPGNSSDAQEMKASNVRFDDT